MLFDGKSSNTVLQGNAVFNQLSEEVFGTNLLVLNVQSYPIVGKNWTIMFNTTGNANLTIKATDGTTWSNSNENEDLKLLGVKCGNNEVQYQWINNSVFIGNYSCNEETSYEISKVLTAGSHHIRFQFGDIVKYAHNFVNGEYCGINFAHPVQEFIDSQRRDLLAIDTNGNLFIKSLSFNNNSGSISEKTNGINLYGSELQWAFNYTDGEIAGSVMEEATLPDTVSSNDILIRNSSMNSNSSLVYFDSSDGNLLVFGKAVYDGAQAGCIADGWYCSDSNTRRYSDHFCNASSMSCDEHIDQQYDCTRQCFGSASGSGDTGSGDTYPYRGIGCSGGNCTISLCPTACNICVDNTGCSGGSCSAANCEIGYGCSSGSCTDGVMCGSSFQCSSGVGDNRYGDTPDGGFSCQGTCDAMGNCDYATNCEVCLVSNNWCTSPYTCGSMSGSGNLYCLLDAGCNEQGNCYADYNTDDEDNDLDGWYDSLCSNSDCCDSDSNTNPDQTGWFTSTNSCGDYDYNCDGQETEDTRLTYSACTSQDCMNSDCNDPDGCYNPSITCGDQRVENGESVCQQVFPGGCSPRSGDGSPVGCH